MRDHRVQSGGRMLMFKEEVFENHNHQEYTRYVPASLSR